MRSWLDRHFIGGYFFFVERIWTASNRVRGFIANVFYCCNHVPFASKSYLIRLRTAAHGRSVFSKHRHHSRVDTLASLSTSQLSMNGLIQRSFWSCSKSNSSEVDKRPSLFMSKWPNIHFASILQAAGKWAVAIRIWLRELIKIDWTTEIDKQKHITHWS